MGPELHVHLGRDPPNAGLVVLVEGPTDPAENPGSDSLVSGSRARGEDDLPVEDLDSGPLGIPGNVGPGGEARGGRAYGAVLRPARAGTAAAGSRPVRLETPVIGPGAAGRAFGRRGGS